MFEVVLTGGGGQMTYLVEGFAWGYWGIGGSYKIPLKKALVWNLLTSQVPDFTEH